MGLTFGNPAGLWALGAIPVILLIHFLQRETRRESVSTLFLIERLHRETQKGRRLERLRHSASLWLQILAVILLTWLLVEPRWLRPDSVQRIAVVLDDSVSMRAFAGDGEAGVPELPSVLRRLQRGAAETEWILLESSGRRGTLYSGSDRRELLERAGNWRPQTGSHNAAPALRRAIASVHPGGSVLFVTDRRRGDAPEGIEVLGVGEPIANAGFTGLRLEEREGRLVWRALVRNYSEQTETRTWWAEFDEGTTKPEEIRLEPRGTLALSGVLPESADRAALVLESDRFGLDDRLPLVRPAPKTLILAAPDADSPLRAELTAFLDSLEHWREAGPQENADFRFATFNPAEDPAGSGVFFALADPAPPEHTGAPVTAERHPLTENLAWHGLDAAPVETFPLRPEDTTLLWRGDQPLLVLRENRGQKQLLVYFDLRTSNADRLPAFVILLHRFLDELRGAKIAYARRNVHTGQRLQLAVDPFGEAVTLRSETGPEQPVTASRASLLRAPGDPGFFSLHQGDNLLLEAAAHFADSREADFRDAETFRLEPGRDRQREHLERNSHRDFLAPLWMLLLGGVLLLSWRCSDRET